MRQRSRIPKYQKPQILLNNQNEEKGSCISVDPKKKKGSVNEDFLQQCQSNLPKTESCINKM